MTEEQKSKCRMIYEHYGLDNQLRILQEECAELIQAASKHLRAQEAGKPIAQSKAALLEEVADVMIMVEQVKGIFTGTALDAMIESKLNRQLGRIRSEKNEKTAGSTQQGKIL